MINPNLFHPNYKLNLKNLELDGFKFFTIAEKLPSDNIGAYTYMHKYSELGETVVEVSQVTGEIKYLEVEGVKVG